jgi:predicted site-specific integrase-resolvase
MELRDNIEILPQALLSRRALAQRWSCSRETVKRRTKEGILHPVRFNQRMLRYRLSEVEQVERAASEGVS